ncbi:hypothetical protein [Sphingomonas sp. SRS2]|uniref:hypothetical protein n=1 Tax=Sphingomonas sp. SRS2 TaxID=133190 RepID=UPI0006184F5C|nr:hypothetical protein [Sphingomonas sp. SRS2]KKC24447.1 hypothetical protein WP12_19340 [Sphingomonas sp. SRS2]
MLANRMVMFGRAAYDGRLIEAIEGRSSWRPNTGLALAGDMAVTIGPTMLAGFNSLGLIGYRVLQETDMAKTFAVSDATRPFSVIVLRNVMSITQRLSGSAGISKAVAGFAKAAGHGGLLIATRIDPNSLVVAPVVKVNSVSIPSTIRAYSAPAAADQTNNLHSYLYPDRATYPDAAAFEISSTSADYSCSYSIFELIAA